jgi:energy-converting hydrogenase Eha subunit A
VNAYLFVFLWFFAPTIFTILIACVLSLLRIKPPKPRRDGWFGPYP